MSEKSDYIVVLSTEYGPIYLDANRGLDSVAEVAVDALGFASVAEALEARDRLNLRWRCGAVIKHRRIPIPTVELIEVF